MAPPAPCRRHLPRLLGALDVLAGGLALAEQERMKALRPGLRVQGLGLGVWGLGCGGWRVWFRVKVRVWGLECRGKVRGWGFMVQGQSEGVGYRVDPEGADGPEDDE